MADSRKATQEHINHVCSLLCKAAAEILKRAIEHDQAKLESPEVEVFDEFTDKLSNSTYGSSEYKKFLEQMKPALDHHYQTYRHHPEHFEKGIDEMNLVDLIEMICDWQSAVKRHADGDINKSIKINAERFGISPQLKRILENTVKE